MRTMICLLCVLVGCNLLIAPREDNPPSEQMKLLWEIPYQFVGTAVTATPLMLGDSLVIMSAGKELLAIEQNTGNIRWRTFVSNETNIQTDEFRTDGYRVFATHVEDIRAYSLADGSMLWKTTIASERGGFWSASLDYSGGRVFAGGYTVAYALDSETGAIVWSRQLQPDGNVYDAVANENRVYFGGVYSVRDSSAPNNSRRVGKIYCLDRVAGDTLWTYTLKGIGGPRRVIIDGNTIYSGTTFESPSSLDALDATTGEQKWSHYTPNEYWDYNEITLVRDKVIANAGPYHVAAFNKHTGQLLWRMFIVEDANAGKLHYYNGYVYHPHGIRVRILDPESGRVVYTLNGANENRLYTMAAGNGRIFVQGSRYLQCYEAYKP